MSDGYFSTRFPDGNIGNTVLEVKSDTSPDSSVLRRIINAEQRVEAALGPILAGASSKYEDNDLTALVAHYRGVQVLSQKKTAIYAAERLLTEDEQFTEDDERALHEVVLHVYETIQNQSRYTLNALLTAATDSQKKRAILTSEFNYDCPYLCVTCLSDESADDLRINLCMGPKFAAFIVGKSVIPLTAIAEALVKLPGKRLRQCLNQIIQRHDALAKLLDTGENDTNASALRKLIASTKQHILTSLESLVKSSEDIGRLRALLVHGLEAATWRVAGDFKEDQPLFHEVDKLRALLAGCFAASSGGSSVYPEQDVYNTYKPILRMLQGIICFHLTYGGYIHCEAHRLTPDDANLAAMRVSDAASSWTAIHKTRPANEAPENSMHEYLRRAFWKPTANSICRDMLVVSVPDQQGDSGDACPDITAVFQDPIPRKTISDICRNSNIPVTHLCAVARLAEVMRPQAVHEERPLEIAFVVGTSYHREVMFKPWKTLASYRDIRAPHQPALGLAWIEWLPVCEKEARKLLNKARWFQTYLRKKSGAGPKKKSGPRQQVEEQEENECKNLVGVYLSLCSARIKGRFGDFSGPSKLLFVDYSVKFPAVTDIVSLGEAAAKNRISLRKVTAGQYGANTRDMCIIRVCGRRRIELLYQGRVELCWNDDQAKWQKPPHWDAASLRARLETLFPSHKKRMSGWVDNLCEVISRISDAPGEGASILIVGDDLPEECVGPMTERTKEEESAGPYKLTKLEQDDLHNLAIQDGAVILSLQKQEVKCRQVYRPFVRKRPKVKGKAEAEVLEPFNLYTHRTEKGILLHEAWRSTDSEYRWDGWPAVLHWGTRHLNSLGMTACFSDTVCICVSADGPIHVFHKGHALEPEEDKGARKT